MKSQTNYDINSYMNDNADFMFIQMQVKTGLNFLENKQWQEW